MIRNKEETVFHTFEPVFDEAARVLILGTMPSPKSREQGFYYGHPRNRFWMVLADICGEVLPETIEEKKALALHHHIAIWDVLAGCDICGADDSSIKNPVPNDMSIILNHAKIEAVFTTGTKAQELYRRYCLPVTGVPSIKLPSTSPANCGVRYEDLKEAYKQVTNYL